MDTLEIVALIAVALVVLTVSHMLAYLAGRAKGHRALNERLQRAGSNVRV